MILFANGPLYMGDYDPINGKASSGYLVNLRKIGCANARLGINFTVTTDDVKESCSGSRLTFASIETEKSGELTLEMNDVLPRELAYALGGTLTDVSASTASAEIFPTVAVGDVVQLKYGNVSSVVIQDSAGTPATLVLNTDYTIEDAANGIIGIANIGSYVQPFSADYSYAEQGNIVAFNNSGVERGIVFPGINHDGTRFRAIIPRARLALNGDLNLLSSERSPLTLSGQMLYVEQYTNDAVHGPFMRIMGGTLF